MALTKVIGDGTGDLTQLQILNGSNVRAASSDADDLIVEGPADCGISILSATTGRIYFGDAANDDAGSIRYVHSDNSMRFETNDVEAMRISSGGAITKPLQPAFMVHPGATAQNNFAASAITNVDFGTERFDLSGDFASNTFTAPTSGVYHFDINLNFNGFDQDFTYVWLILATSNSDYYIHLIQGNMADDDGYMNFGGSILADMDASDTAHVKLQIQGGAAQMDIITQTSSSFSGYLVA